MRSNQDYNASPQTKRHNKSNSKKNTTNSLVEISTSNYISKSLDESIWSTGKEFKECALKINNSLAKDENEWLKCAKIVERFFLVIWVVTICVCFMFTLHGLVENMYRWESL